MRPRCDGNHATDLLGSTMNAKQTVLDAVAAVFGDRDLTAVDRYFGPVYKQHSALGADGTEGLKTLIKGLPADFAFRALRVIVDGDVVVTHGLYEGFGPAPIAGFDVWRVVDGRIVEHWDALAPVGGQTPEDTAPVEGQTEPGDVDQTSNNRVLVTDWVRRVLIEGEEKVDDFVSLGSVDRSRAGAPIRIPTSAAGELIPYTTLHQVIAEGDLVFTRVEGAGEPSLILNDLWRVSAGRIVERWSVVAAVPAQLAHTNGSF